MTGPAVQVRTLAGLRAEREDLQAQLHRYAAARHPRPDLAARLRRVQALVRAREATGEPDPVLVDLCPSCGADDQCRPDCPAIPTDNPEGLF